MNINTIHIVVMSTLYCYNDYGILLASLMGDLTRMSKIFSSFVKEDLSMK